MQSRLKPPPRQDGPRPSPRRRYAPRIQGVKRVNLIQARLNDSERARLDRLREQTGLSDSDVVRRALALLDGEDG